MSVSQNDSASSEDNNHILEALNHIDLQAKIHEINKKRCEESFYYSQDDCLPVWDNITCWPATLKNTFAVMPCMAELNGITYDATRKFSLIIHDF